jgi:hypothetical protein
MSGGTGSDVRSGGTGSDVRSSAPLSRGIRRIFHVVLSGKTNVTQKALQVSSSSTKYTKRNDATAV